MPTARDANPPPEAGGRRKLPIGIQTFSEIRTGGYYYVDKTAGLRRLIDAGKHFFLSRPRRFGKSLLVDTLKQLFEGNRPLFEGLAIHDHWDWTVRHPVLRLDFSGGDFTAPDALPAQVADQIAAAERRAGLAGAYASLPGRFAGLIEALHEQRGQRVVVLVDEYDKPILDALETPDAARANRNFLRGLYGTIKSSDAHVRFTFITGVSRSLQRGCARGHPSHETASKVSLFSGPNNLIDVTLDPRHGALCGYTDADLDTVFAPELPGLDRDAIRDWYDGYRWVDAETVYNPFDILLLFDRREFGAYWFETGTPAFLIDTLVSRGVETFALDGLLGTDELLSSFDVDDVAPEALLFQTGYLTIRDVERIDGTRYYRLGYPNREVRQSLNQSLLRHLVRGASRGAEPGPRLLALLRANDFAGLEELFRAFFAGIPHQWYSSNDIARYEGYYASVFYACLAALGLDVRVEDSTSRGRLDLAVAFNDQMYLFEFKVVERAAAGAALAQLRDKRYAEKYRGLGAPIHLIGVEFSQATRGLTAFDVATD